MTRRGRSREEKKLFSAVADKPRMHNVKRLSAEKREARRKENESAPSLIATVRKLAWTAARQRSTTRRAWISLPR